MPEYEGLTPKDAYIEGRLLGLNELIKLLKDAVEAGGDATSSALVKSVVLHISNEMESVLVVLREKHGADHPAVQKAEEQHSQVKAQAVKLQEKEPLPDQEVKEQVQAADDLMSNLISIKEKPVEEAEKPVETPEEAPQPAAEAEEKAN